MKAEEIAFKSIQDIKNAQQILIALENTQKTLWRQFKKAVVKETDKTQICPTNDMLGGLVYKAKNGKEITLEFNPYQCLIPRFHFYISIYNPKTNVFEKIGEFSNIYLLLANDKAISCIAKKYASLIINELNKNNN